jgi:hypothetical protein
MEILLISARHLSTAFRRNVEIVCHTRAEHHFNLDGGMSQLQMKPHMVDVLTPNPFVNKQNIFNVSPTLPSMNRVTNPEDNTERGIRIVPPQNATRSLSSGTHSPFRRIFLFAMV